MTVIYKKDTGRLKVAEAKRLIIEAMPDDEPGYVAFSGTVDADGIEHWDIDNPKHQTYRETVQFRLNNSFLDLCREAGFEPHLSIDPSTKGYRLREVDDRLYMVTHAQFVRLAEVFSLTVVVGDEPAATSAPVLVTASDAPAKPSALAWSLKTSIQRAPGYRWPLYQTLKDAHIAGLPCPKPRDVLDTWTLKPPPDLQVMPDGVKYNDQLGNPKEADLKAIGQAIKGLLNPSAG